MRRSNTPSVDDCQHDAAVFGQHLLQRFDVDVAVLVVGISRTVQPHIVAVPDWYRGRHQAR